MQYTASRATPAGALMHAPDRIEIPNRFNLVDHFVDRHLREGRGSKIALVSGETRLTYEEVAAQINRVGNGLLELGLQEEQRVLLVLPDGPEFVAAYFGVMKIGAVAVPTSTALRSSDYAYFLDESRARVAIVYSALLAEFELALSGQRDRTSVVVCGEPVEGYLHWNEFLKNASPSLEAARTNKDDVAFWLWTSGSTGPPKAAVHLHRHWAYCCEYYARGV